MKQRFTLIGLSDEAAPALCPDALRAIACGRIFSGGRRHREIVGGLLPAHAEWIDIAPPLDEVFRCYADHSEIVVFASGDPLFFGFAATVRRRLPDAEVRIFPAMNSLQMLAHRMVMPYHDMRIVSLTGREWHELDRALIEAAPKIGVLTDHRHTPAAIARRLSEYGYTNYRMVVGQRLGNRASERIAELTLEQASGSDFDAPNCVILHGAARRAPLGLPEEAFELLDGRANMITKMPVRLLALSMLGLENRRCLWDVGFCTGSVSIEAKLRFPHLHVCAFEVREEGERLMGINARRFGAPGIRTRIGNFLDVPLSDLPTPDALFIGGYGGRLEQVVARGASVLEPGGTMVFNSVGSQSRDRFEAALGAAGMRRVDCVRIAVDEHNPIEVIKAEKIA